MTTTIEAVTLSEDYEIRLRDHGPLSKPRYDIARFYRDKFVGPMSDFESLKEARADFKLINSRRHD